MLREIEGLFHQVCVRIIHVLIGRIADGFKILNVYKLFLQRKANVNFCTVKYKKTGCEYYHTRKLKYCWPLLFNGGDYLFECFWFIDIVCSYQPELKSEDFQVWTLRKNEDGSGKVVCTVGNERVLKTQVIPFFLFDADKATVWVEGNIVLLPSEH